MHLDSVLLELGFNYGLKTGAHTNSFWPLDLEDLEFQEFSPAEGSPGGCSEAPFQARSHKPEVGLQPEGANESS